MKYQIIGKNIQVTDAISSAIKKKLSRMDKFFLINDDVECRDFNDVVNAIEKYCQVKLNVILDDTVILDDEDTFVV